MLTKFETKSNRVKGLSFHPKRYGTRRVKPRVLPLVFFPPSLLVECSAHPAPPEPRRVTRRGPGSAPLESTAGALPDFPKSNETDALSICVCVCACPSSPGPGSWRVCTLA